MIDYKTIIDNVNNIEFHDYVGAATTLTKDVFSLVDSLKELGEIFNTVGYKPARNCDEAFTEESIDKWLVEYEKLTLFLLDECMNNNDKYIKLKLAPIVNYRDFHHINSNHRFYLNEKIYENKVKFW